MRIVIYVEGGGSSKELHARCREGFRKLLEKCGYRGRGQAPKLVACGGRGAVFDHFRLTHINRSAREYAMMLIDSEEPLGDIEATWEHLENFDRWDRPQGATDDQVLFMTTCMETWVVADHEVLKKHYGNQLQISALPPLVNLENRSRHADIQDRLIRATRNCINAYNKGKRSFEVVGKLTPETLKQYLPSFERDVEILNEKLPGIPRPPAFMLTKASLENLKNDGCPEPAVWKLSSVEGKRFQNQNIFWSIVKKILGREQASQYEQLILQHVERPPKA